MKNRILKGISGFVFLMACFSLQKASGTKEITTDAKNPKEQIKETISFFKDKQGLFSDALKQDIMRNPDLWNDRILKHQAKPEQNPRNLQFTASLMQRQLKEKMNQKIKELKTQ